MGLIRITGTRNALATANGSSPHSLEPAMLGKSGDSHPKILSNPYHSWFFALCRADS